MAKKAQPERSVLRVLVVDNHEPVRKGLCELLRSQAGIEICEGTNGRDAVDFARE